jgi:hypothetical protein
VREFGVPPLGGVGCENFSSAPFPKAPPEDGTPNGARLRIKCFWLNTVKNLLSEFPFSGKKIIKK